MDVLGIGRLPFLSRGNFKNELQHLLFWSVLVGVVEGQFASVLVSKVFGAGDFLIAIATATPFAANVLSLAWGMLCIGRPKIRLATIFATAAVLCVGAVGLIPRTAYGTWWFIVQMAAAQAMLAGAVTVRSAIWKSNYPVEVRGQVAAQLHRLRSLMSVVTVQVAAALCDRDPAAYRYVFPAAALSGAIGVLLLSRIRVRGEAGLLRADKPGGAASQISFPMVGGDAEACETVLRGRGLNRPAGNRSAAPRKLTLWRVLSPGYSIREMGRVLARDRRFAWYCVAQFLHGVSNLLTLPVVVAVMTRSLDTGQRGGFWISTGLIIGLPTLTLLGSLPRWGRLFDSEGVLRFRVINVLCWAAALLFGMSGTLLVISRPELGPGAFLVAVTLFAARGLIYGVAQAGGQIAWNLGHLHFADPHRAEVYMGIHVFLTGVRGLMAPLFGMWLWNLVGWPVWVIAIGLALTSVGVYSSLARSDERLNRETPAEPPSDA